MNYKRPLVRSLALGALGLAASSTFAQSSVQLFGLVDMMAYRKQLAGEPHVNRIDNGGLNTSYWGIRGREDLGGGLAARFELTGFLRADTGSAGRNDTDALYSRSSWVGLTGPWGNITLGRQSTPAFTNLVRYSAFGASSALNPAFLQNYLASATQPLMTGSGAADSTWSNAVSYETPKFSGFSGSVYAAPSEATTAGRRVGGSISYTRGSLSVGLVAEDISKMSLNFSKPPANVLMTDSRLWSLGASYDFKVVKLYGLAVRTELHNNTSEIDMTSYNLGASAPVGAGRVLFSYGQTTKSQTAQADAKRRTATLAYDYNLSRRTDLYAAVINDHATGRSSGTGFAAGIRHRF